MHVNDNDLRQDLHQSIGQGRTNWLEYQELAPRFCPDASVLVEVKGTLRQEQSLAYMKKNRLYPFV